MPPFPAPCGAGILYHQNPQKMNVPHVSRLIMMREGRIIIDREGEEKKKLTAEDLFSLFVKQSGKEFTNDRATLA